MEKEFIPYGLAVKLKELGFDEKVFGYYTNDKDYPFILDVRNLENKYTEEVKVPTFSQAFRWFREKYGLKFYIRQDIWNNWCSLKMVRHDDYISIGEYKTYEESELDCLKKLIEIVENEKTL
jgi:hypothetical protein